MTLFTALPKRCVCWIVLIVGCFFRCYAGEPRIINVSDEPAFAPENGMPYLLERHINMHFIGSDRLVLMSDLYGPCDDLRKDNAYSILAVNLLTGTVSARRTIPAAPDSLYLIVDFDKEPVLVSRRSLEVLDPISLKTKRTIDFQGLHVDAVVSRSETQEESKCGTKPFMVSATPDSSRLEVEIPNMTEKTTQLLEVDGKTLEFRQTLKPGFMPDFRIGFSGVYQQTFRQQWYDTKDAEAKPVCNVCDYLDVLSPESILVGTDNALSLMIHGKAVWNTHHPGMREGLATSAKGDRFVILSAGSYELFRKGISFTPTVFDVTHKSTKRLPGLFEKQAGDIEGGLRSAIAMSADGLQVAAFVNGRIALYNLSD